MLPVLYLCCECLYWQTTHGWNSLRHLLTLSGSRAAWRPLLAVSCGVECAASRLNCDTCYRVFLSVHTTFKWLPKAIAPTVYIVIKLKPKSMWKLWTLSYSLLVKQSVAYVDIQPELSVRSVSCGKAWDVQINLRYKHLYRPLTVLSRVHTSAKAQQSHLIQSSLIQYQENTLQSSDQDLYSSHINQTDFL